MARDLVPLHTKKPPWLRSRLPSGPVYEGVRSTLRALGLHTVCESSRCPNVGRCWSEGTATMMVMGDVCTRGCRFCHIGSARVPPALDEGEPDALADGIARLGLAYAVITSVDRDDLPDHGAAHLARCVRAAKRRNPDARVELLMPDLGGEGERIAAVVAAGADVLAHNLETVERLTGAVRDRRAGYRRSLDVLAAIRALDADVVTKSALMLGLGEQRDEVLRTFDDLRAAGVKLLTLGQYLQPSPRHLPVVSYVPPERFHALADEARCRGFAGVAAGPLVRSSYRARELFEAIGDAGLDEDGERDVGP